MKKSVLSGAWLLCFVLLASCANDAKQDEKLKDNQEIKDGNYTEYYPNGQVRIVGRMSNGNRVGRWSAWYRTGELQAESNYSDQGKLHGEYTIYYENGKSKIKGEWDNGAKSGKWYFYQSDGKIAREKQY